MSKFSLESKLLKPFLQEYYRIGNVQKEAAAIQAGELIDGHEVYDVEDYHYAIDDKGKKVSSFNSSVASIPLKNSYDVKNPKTGEVDMLLVPYHLLSFYIKVRMGHLLCYLDYLQVFYL